MTNNWSKWRTSKKCMTCEMLLLNLDGPDEATDFPCDLEYTPDSCLLEYDLTSLPKGKEMGITNE